MNKETFIKDISEKAKKDTNVEEKYQLLRATIIYGRGGKLSWDELKMLRERIYKIGKYKE